MKKISLFLALALFCLGLPGFAIQAFGQEDEAKLTDDARYALYDLKVGNEMVPFLLDTRTGKVWMYQSDIGTKKKFVGMSVEGIAYSREEKDVEALNKQIEQWHFDGFIDKNIKGLREKLCGEFSYSPDIEKVVKIYEKMKRK